MKSCLSKQSNSHMSSHIAYTIDTKLGSTNFQQLSQLGGRG